jgi:pyruvate,water dikinase
MGAPALVCDFAEIEGDALPLVGGKAANLGILTRAGLPVPPGVAVTTEAYRLVAASDALASVLDELAGAAPGDTARLAALAGRARAALLAADVPEDVRRAVADGYARLGRDVPVAVRSSATAEDLPFASFAGQQDTYLNVVGEEAVLDATRRCWASLWTDRAVSYRATNGIDHRTVHLAVVIQRMVDAVVAGVLFTANPVTGRRMQAVIDASPGLGEAVVSGAVNPDHFVLDTKTGEILERRLGDKRVAVRAKAGGGTEHVERPSAGGEACLTDEQVRALAALGARVEAYYGSPQDTEWAIASDGALWLTQARPITTLFPLPASAPPPGEGLAVYFCFSVAQGLNRPITPMGLAAFRVLGSAASDVLGYPVSDPLAGPIRYADAGGRLFIDLTGILRSVSGRELMPRMLDVMEARSAVVLRSLFDDPRLAPTIRSKLPAVRRALRLASRFQVPVTAARAVFRPESARARAEEVGRGQAARLAVPAGATASERLDFVEQTLFNEGVPVLPHIMPTAGVGLAALPIAGKLLGSDATPDELETVTRGLPHNVTTEMNLALWDLAGRIRKDSGAAALLRGGSPDDLAERYRAGTLPGVAQAGLAEFLGRWGHRAIAEIDVGVPRWSDDPRHLLGVLASYLKLEPGPASPDAVFARGAAEAEAMVETLAARARRKSRLRGAAVRFALTRVRELAGLRELPKYDLIVMLGAVRRELKAVGTELAAKGVLAAADDVFFLDLVEARAGLGGKDLKEVVAKRRETYELELRRRHVPRVLLSDGTEPEARSVAADGEGGALTGTPASAGQVTGVAHVILDPVGAKLEPGEILVAPSTDPGWTPLFLVAGGLVMEMGGANSHGAVVAREYGIPAVVGVPNATARVATGQRITVDGSAGRVTAEPAPAGR